ncbi:MULTISPECIES: LVIVD repeat-containing protein [Reichenbachiella]|uniref:LVIVD repeat-containing protein n=1 Tax=Reichenbachiella TaxID=156993 RepID=UPI000E6BA000|nr:MULTISPECIES: hypothetical protein [Reichenbachiella]MBU2916221.1 hypothetical protein [Reichenbachiella agariperforans]
MKKLNLILTIVLAFALWSCEDGESAFEFDNQGTSTSGSIAKFQIDSKYLYVVEENSLSIYDVTDFEQLSQLSKVYVDREVETLFRLGDILYLGTTSGVLFYDITNVNQPSYVSSYDHITACDPVVSDGSYAYSTLRSSNTCGGGSDVLDIINLSDISAPSLTASYDVASPYGLVLFDNYLYVGQGLNGMKVFDITDVTAVTEVVSYDEITAIDFIRDGDNLIITTRTGLVQAKVGDDGTLSILSKINY